MGVWSDKVTMDASEIEVRAREAIDAAHAGDPEGDAGRPAEAVYADRLEAWVRRLVPAASRALRLAARAQHLERWAIPRTDYPEGRGGYLRWRSAVHARQGERAAEILRAAGAEEALTERVVQLVSKRVPLTDPEAEALEDAACLVFLEQQLAGFSKTHERAKVVAVLRKTWKKMSPHARDAAQSLPLPPELRELVGEAVTG